jgi:hypothetical protein
MNMTDLKSAALGAVEDARASAEYARAEADEQRREELPIALEDMIGRAPDRITWTPKFGMTFTADLEVDGLPIRALHQNGRWQFSYAGRSFNSLVTLGRAIEAEAQAASLPTAAELRAFEQIASPEARTTA